MCPEHLVASHSLDTGRLERFTVRNLISTGLTLILVFAIGVLGAQPTTTPPNAPAPIAIDGVSMGGGWRLPETHFVSAKMPMKLVHPRSMPGNDETNSWARHKWAYPGIEYRIPVSIQGGAYPFYYEILSGPSWLTIGGTVYEDDYGVLHGVAPATPQASETVVLRVTDQELTKVDIEFPLTVTTDGFIFVDVNAKTSGDGTIGSPLKLFSELHGGYYPGSGSLGNPATTAYSGKRVYLRGGVHQVADIPTPTISWADGRPQVILGYPGESVDLNFTNGKLNSIRADFFFGGLTARFAPDLNLLPGTHWTEVEGRTSGASSSLYAIDDSWAIPNASRLFEPQSSAGRITLFEFKSVHHRGLEYRSIVHPSLGGAGNNAILHTATKGVGSYNEYLTFWDIGIQDQAAPLVNLYATRYGVAEKVVHLPDSGDIGAKPATATYLLFLKSQNAFWSVRRCRWTEKGLDTSANGALYLSTTNRPAGNDSLYVEAAYNLVHSVGNTRGRTINYNQSGAAIDAYAPDNTIWIYRNTLIGAMHGMDRPYTVAFENNVIMMGQGVRSGDNPEGQYPPDREHRTVVVSGPDILDIPENWEKYLDADYKLKGTYRTNMLGIVGHEIGVP